MKVFVDANILVAVLNKEYPLFSTAARVLSLSESYRFEIVTSPLCLAIAFYFSSKKSGESMALKKMNLLSSQLSVCNMNAIVVQHTIQNKKIHDFEDGLQYYAAMEAGCEVFVTENLADFYFSETPITDCLGFLNDYVLKKG